MRRRENALYLVFKIAQRLERSWRPLNGGLTVMTLLLGGARFIDGVYVPELKEVSAARIRSSGWKRISGGASALKRSAGQP